MGLMDKAKFWKKGEEDLGDLSDLGDFGLDDKPGGGAPPGGEGLGPLHEDTSLGGGAPFGGEGPGPLHEDIGGHEMPGLEPGTPLHREEVQPTQASQDMGDQFGLRPAAPEHPMAPAAPAPLQQQMPGHVPGLAEFSKDIEIIHAKLDAIKSSLDSMNQRLATLERIASPETKNRYSW
jgi:hypothetical protein